MARPDQRRNPLLVIITGPPAAGKTTVARRLAQEIDLPLFVRDDIKERLFEELGWSDRAWSTKLGAASWELLYDRIECLLRVKQSLMAEGNFSNEFAQERLARFQSRYGCRLMQLYCIAPPETLFTCFKQRALSGERHPGHVDHLGLDTEKFHALAAGWEPVDVDGVFLEIDTSDFATVDYSGIVATIQRELYTCL